ncbi:inactive protein kinase SELMODRAFT_444075-like [Impatiens glandulifera]|uniref:inactive protein kinase SELMODRAFT_444075-like n=1 Tax=Impatiens glandulifera TaxID=253017 RepID=UPI001FB0744A|nr:inactive protein kinase SELMODRAFT_444075-like [Impatiens glandulifera]
MTQRACDSAPEKVMVAVKAEKVISKTALTWALTHVVRPGDCIIMLAVLSAQKTARRRFWNFPSLTGDCSSGDQDMLPDRISQISESCSQMVLQLHDQIEVRVRIKVISGMSIGVVAAEAKSREVNWVILDKKLKHEQKHCVDQLQCNIVMMKGSQPKILKLNLGWSDGLETPFFSASSSPDLDAREESHSNRMRHSTPISSPGENSPPYIRITEDKIASPEDANSLLVVYEKNPLFEGTIHGKCRANNKQKNLNPVNRVNGDEGDYFLKSSIREVVSLSRASSVPPPLCSLCENTSPSFGKPPRRFSYQELREATDGFSNTNLLVDRESGTVHRGILRDGLKVAVKTWKFVGSQQDSDFFRELWILSCAQHRNVVLLIGFCVEGEDRLLIYEYICNGSLDFHLHGRASLDWHSRQRIAIGVARGLRYLHEDCRVGCIVHRDIRPKNILLTHDYEPLVADFGLARLYTEWDPYDERVECTSGYLAPEYYANGKITEKVDIYAFGLILLELITGKRSIALKCHVGHHLTEGSFCSPSVLESGPLLSNIDKQPIHWCMPSDQLKRLPREQQAMGLASFLCLQVDPESRPPMSKVLRILEGGDSRNIMDSDPNSVGSRSARMGEQSSNTRHAIRKRHSRKNSQ